LAASRKRKRNTVKKTLKYEVYGILFLIFSVITLASTGADSGVGSVGRSLGSICYFLAGRLPYVIPLVFIYIGLYVMIYRKWPKRWTARRSGVLLAVIAVLITYQMNEFHAEGIPYTAGDIMKHPFDQLAQVLKLEIDQATYRAHAGGGLVGALSYGLLYFLFADIGAILMVIALFAISFVYITGITYTDMFRSLRRKLANLRKVLKMRWREMIKKRRNKKKDTSDEGDDDTPDDDGVLPPVLIDEETYNPHRRPKKKPVFMNLFFPDKQDERHRDDRDDEEIEEKDDWQEHAPHDEDPDGRQHGEDEPLNGLSGVYTSQDAQEPVFRDFLERVEQQVAELESEDEKQPVMNQLEEEPTDPPAHPVDPAESPVQVSQAGSEAPSTPSKLSGKEPDIRIQLTPVPVKEQRPYQLPPFSLLNKPAGAGGKGGQMDYISNARKLEATLESFGVRAKVLEVVRGPAVTRYEIQPDVGVKVSRIVNLTDDIALALAAKDIRMEAPIPGKSAIGIEIPNDEISVVTLREVMESPAFHESSSRLSIALGRDISGQAIVANLAKMPHLLVAGATGSGKSVCINGIITSILYKAKPTEVKFLLIDPKMVELSVYNGIPHLLSPVVTDPRRASLALKKIVVEMEKRYELFSKSGIRNIEGYNALIQEKIASGDLSQAPLPYIVVIVDELADLMMVAASDVEESITRIAQKARAAGIHLILATQRPSVDVITGVIKANIPSRIAFGVSSQVDSRTILDSAGAEKLLGRGDMLFLPVGASKSIRIQGAFLSDQEVEAVCDFVRKQEEANYRTDIVPEVEETQEAAEEHEDELYDQAVQIVIEAKQASVSLLQRRMRIGYTRAARLIDAMEAKGVVGPYEGSKPREVLMTMEQYQQRRISS
jgi:S-DNA-T family DNA segregation ATPase FtsK/SpoIIIE